MKKIFKIGLIIILLLLILDIPAMLVLMAICNCNVMPNYWAIINISLLLLLFLNVFGLVCCNIRNIIEFFKQEIE